MSDSDKEVENQIVEAGEKLIDPPSSVDELLSLLDKLFLCLADVEQSPPDSMQNALSPLMKALVAEKLFKHSDADVKVAVAACISEITRITAPDAPYDDDQMKEVFKLIVSSFENLVDESSRSYPKRTSILETVAKVRSCVVMLDLECDALLIEMFQHFLKAVSDHHPGNVFSSMENIMTLVLEESEDIPPEMLSPILQYAKKDDEIPQASRKLAEQVLSNCASKLKPYLTVAVKSLGASLDKYIDIVASICEGKQDQLATNEKEDSEGHLTKDAEVEHDKQKAAEISTPELTDAPKDESGKSGVSNGVVQQNDSSVDTESTKKEDVMNAKDEPQQLDNPSNTDLDNTSEEKPDVENQIKEEGKQHSPVIQAESSKTSDIKEETEPGKITDSSKDATSSLPDDSSVNAAVSSSENEKKTSVQDLPSKASAADETANVSSPPRAEDLPEENRPKKAVNQKKKESSTKDDKPSAADETANVSSPPRAEDLPEESRSKKAANQKKKESSTKEAKPSPASVVEEASEEANTSETKVTKKSGKKVASSSKAKPALPPSKKSTSETKAAKQSEKKAAESDDVQESSKPKEENKKTGRGRTMEEETVHTSSGDNEKPAVSSGKSASKSKKEGKQASEETPNTNTKRKRNEKASDLQDYDENLIGSKVKVWWPYDRAYYEGVVKSYDPAKKKHKVCYDDGEEEVLNLKRQKWYFVHETESSEDEEAGDQAGRDEEASTAPQRKKAKNSNQSGKKVGGAGSSKAKAAPASKSAKKSQDESKAKESKEEEDSSEEQSEEEETPKTVGKSAGAKSGNSKSKKDMAKSKAAASSKKKEEPLKNMVSSSKSKTGTAKSSSSAKGKTGKDKGKASTPSSKAKESDAESDSEDSPKAAETTKGKSVGSGKSQGSQAKSGKKRKR